MNEIMIIEQNGKKYLFELTAKVHKHFGTDSIYAVAVWFTGHIIFNLDFDSAKYEERIILTK